jgi:hypothetical protein
MKKYPTLNEFERGLEPRDALGIGSKYKKIDAMNCLLRFLFNADYNFIKQIWGGTFLENHLYDKLRNYMKDDSYLSPNALSNFISNLGEENKDLLYTYILENHKS